MARSRTVNARVPHSVRDALKLRFERGEYGDHGEKINRLDVGNSRYMALFPCECKLTCEISSLSPEQQDRIDDFILRLAQTGQLVASLTDEKPLTVATLLKLAKEWTMEKLAKRKQ